MIINLNSTKRKAKSSAIERFNHRKENINMINYLKKEIEILNKEIITLTSGLLEAKKVQFKSAFNRNNNLFARIQQKWIETAANKSAGWHQSNLLEILRQRQQLQIKLDKATGQYWPKIFKRILITILLLMLISLIFSIALLGVFASIYLLPVWICIALVYQFKKKNYNKL